MQNYSLQKTTINPEMLLSGYTCFKNSIECTQKRIHFFQNKYCISSVRMIRLRRQQSIQKCHIFSAKTETRQNRFCFLPWEFLSLTPCFIREFKIWILIHNLTTTTSTGTLLFPGRSGGIEFEKPKWRGKKENTHVGLF